MSENPFETLGRLMQGKIGRRRDGEETDFPAEGHGDHVLGSPPPSRAPDTASAIDHVFGHLLRFRFAPRVRDLADRRLYVADGCATYAALAGGAWAPLARGQGISRIVHRASACSWIRVRRRRGPPLFADCRSAERTAAFGYSFHANPDRP
jgi:Tn3 transposase DDE domain